MSLRALLYAYVFGGLTFLPLLVLVVVFIAVYTSVPVQERSLKPCLQSTTSDDLPPTRKAWLIVRRSFDACASSDGSYVTLVKSYLDSRSKDPKRARPKDTCYVVLKGKVLYLYEDEAMTECEAAIELGSHHVVIYPEALLDGELFTRRNAICLKPRRDDTHTDPTQDEVAPWFIFVKSCVDMEDWYIALVHASDHPSGTPTLNPLTPVFLPSEMDCLVATLDEQPDIIPMRWFNALLGRLFYSFYRTQVLESYIIGRLMKKLSKVKRPAFLTDIAVTQFSVGNKAPTFSKPMLKELTKEGDASLEVRLVYKGEIRATVQATAVINLGARFKSYTVKLVLAVVLRELEGNLLVKVKRPPSSRIWYAFTNPPRMVINVEPIVSDRQITWSMILNTIESKIEEIIIESVVLPNMDDISFFDSLDYQRRGGIWADAVRLDKPVTAQVPEAVPKFPEESILVHTPEAEPTVETPTLDSIPTSTSTSTATKRRSWFHSGVDAEYDSEEEVRGRKERNNVAPSPDISIAGGSDNEQDPNEFLLPRSSSAHSRSSRATSVSSSAGVDESSNYLSDTSATSKSPRHSLGTYTTSSFLSTLKSKAGDKQALSNTAKEAMRKWGVNWGLKKENGNPSPDDLPDVGPSDHRPRTESMHGRQNYADMRASVIERRAREHQERTNGSTSPVPIPQRSDGETGKSPSASVGRMTLPSSGSTSPGLSRSLGDVSGDHLKDRDFPEVVDENASPSLIHTQPSEARTMIIPGIHASHRGEVMSMGNVAPVPPSPEMKPKGPTIQSMYRLWKSPILTGQPIQETQPSSTSPRCGDTNDGNHDVAPLTLTPEPLLRTIPPPLPPRTISSVVVRQITESSDEGLVPSVSPASQALKSIASRDETRRVSVDGEPASDMTAIPSKPPLPPRKMAV